MMAESKLYSLVLAAVVIIGECFAEDTTEVNNRDSVEEEATEYITRLDHILALGKNKIAKAEWYYETNMTEENRNELKNSFCEIAKQEKQLFLHTGMFQWRIFKNLTLQRMFKKFNEVKESLLSDEKYSKLYDTISHMKLNFFNSRVCSYKDNFNCALDLEKDVSEIFSVSQDTDELMHTWLEWHKASGQSVRHDFTKYVELFNEAATLNGYKDAAEMWQSDYEVPDFDKVLANLWNEVKPIYEQVHAYVRRKLRDKYGHHVVSAKGPIPAHLLGNVWSKNWENIEYMTRPFPNKRIFDPTRSMKEQFYTPLRMFEVAEDFFLSLNFSALPESFFKNSIMTKGNGTLMSCEPLAKDMFDGKDFRVKMCSRVNDESLYQAHKLMAQVQYFMEYNNQPIIFREAPHKAFLIAFGEMIALSASSPKHLKRLGLVHDDVYDTHLEINMLFKMALSKLVMLPYVYAMELFRYKVFRGSIPVDNYNCHFWELRSKIQGIEPATHRTEDDFDAAADFHVSANEEMAHIFISTILQYQLHRSVCKAAGLYAYGSPTETLFNCDIYKNEKASKILRKMLQMGSSKPLPDVLAIVTGEKKIKSGSLREYFDPLYKWLRKENKKNGDYVGWEPSRKQFCSNIQLRFLKRMNSVSSQGKIRPPNSLVKLIIAQTVLLISLFVMDWSFK